MSSTLPGMNVISGAGDHLPAGHDWLVIYPAGGGRVVIAKDQETCDLLNDSYERLVAQGVSFQRSAR